MPVSDFTLCGHRCRPLFFGSVAHEMGRRSAWEALLCVFRHVKARESTFFDGNAKAVLMRLNSPSSAREANEAGGDQTMQVLCKSSNERVEAQCSVCGQGFELYWERQTPAEQAESLKEVEAALRDHHSNNPDASAHPADGFLIPAWDGPLAYSGAAILGNAPNAAVAPKHRKSPAVLGPKSSSERRVRDRRHAQHEGWG
jgi:hypothetical protein